MSLNIGDTKLPYGVILAPMAGYTDRGMRMVCRKMGAELSYTEMVSAKAVVFGDRKTAEIAKIRADEGPVILQIFGSEPEIMAEAAHKLQCSVEEGCVSPVAIDINMGCPVNKIFGNGEGSALMKNPDLIYKIVKATSEAIDIPLTVKLRAGVTEASVNAIECALAAEEGGACALTVHGRTRSQMYSGKASLQVIKDVKSAVKIPLIGNGDVTDYSSARAMLDYTGCDGIMIGRGAVGNPFVFKEILSGLKGAAVTPPTFEEKFLMAKEQLELAVLDKGERVAVAEARKQIALYFKGAPGSAHLRAAINSAESLGEIISAIMKCCKANDTRI